MLRNGIDRKALILLFSILFFFDNSWASGPADGKEAWETLTANETIRGQELILKAQTLLSNYGLPFEFWVDAENTAIKADDHPCGSTITEFVKQIPIPGKKTDIEAEKVFEFDERGEVLRQWPLPVDQVVIGIEGEALILRVSLPGERAFRVNVRPNGQLRVVEDSTQLPEPQVIKCPKHYFGRSDYERCWEYRDLVSGNKRQISYQGPCT